MSLPSLFLKETTVGDASYTKLPQDLDLWAENIATQVRQKIPAAKHMLLKINFLKKNEEQGMATGAVVLHDQKLNKAVYLPLIVKNFKLYPMDVMLVPKKDSENGFELGPFSQELFAEALFSSDPFDHLERPIDHIQQLYMNPQNTVIHPPSFRSVHASSGGVLDAIAPTISEQDKVAFVSSLKKDPSLLVGYEKRSNLGVIKKIAESRFEQEPKSKDSLKNITLLKKKDGDQVQMFSTSDEVFDPLIEEGGHPQITSCLEGDIVSPEDTLHEVRRNGEKMVFRDLNPKKNVMLGPLNTPENYTKTEGKSRDIKSWGSYKVQDKNGLILTGVVIPNVINFNMKPTNGKVFLSPEVSSYQDKIVGIPSEKVTSLFLKPRDPAIGMTGVFVASNEKNAIATLPFTIKGLYEANGNTHIVAIDINGGKLKLKYGGPDFVDQDSNETFDSPGELKSIAKMKDHYIIPRRFKFVPMDNFRGLSESAEGMTAKIASVKMDASPVRLIHTGASQFALKGPDMVKMAKMCGWDSTNLSASQAVFLLGSKRCPLEKVAEALKTAGSAHEEVYIHGLSRTNYGETENPQQVKVASAVMEEIQNLRCDLTKEAASIEDAQTVDSILSLNFINEENIDKFLEFVPLFEQASKALAQCVLASRLGVQEIQESSASSAMRKLLDVIRGLKRLRTLEEKTASTKGSLGVGLKRLLRLHAGKATLGAGLGGLAVGSSLSKKKSFGDGYKKGVQDMYRHTQSQSRAAHMNKAAGFFDFDKKNIKVKGVKKKMSARELALKAYKKVHGKNPE